MHTNLLVQPQRVKGVYHKMPVFDRATYTHAHWWHVMVFPCVSCLMVCGAGDTGPTGPTGAWGPQGYPGEQWVHGFAGCGGAATSAPY